MNHEQIQACDNQIQHAYAKGEPLPLEVAAALLAEVRRQAARLYDFEDGHAYTKLRRERDYWAAHYENDKFEIEKLVEELFAAKNEVKHLREELAAQKPGVAA